MHQLNQLCGFVIRYYDCVAKRLGLANDGQPPFRRFLSAGEGGMDSEVSDKSAN